MASAHHSPVVYVPFNDPRASMGLCVDAVLPNGGAGPVASGGAEAEADFTAQLTHHKAQLGIPSELKQDVMSSTDMVLNAVRARHPILQTDTVSSNHFDIDAFTSVWCVLNQEKALQNEPLLREVGRVGDFRELVFEDELSQRALKLCCWLNQEERRVFQRPFAGPAAKMRQGILPSPEDNTKRASMKFLHFIPRFGKVLTDPENEEHAKVWRPEFDRVARDVASAKSAMVHEPTGSLVVRTEEPLHYYALFAPSRGCDTVISLYSRNRYEVEQKYTQFVDISTRGVFPRVDMAPLAALLNELEDVLSVAGAGAGDGSSRARWGADQLRDTGPIMRMDLEAQKLKKDERYGHPFERPIYSSNLGPELFKRVVLSYFDYAYETGKATRGGAEVAQGEGRVQRMVGWSWKELKEFNKSIDWAPWRHRVMEDMGASGGGVGALQVPPVSAPTGAALARL